MRRIVVFILFVLIASFASAQDDGIPNNCPFARGVFYNQNWFIRAEGSGTSVTDWSSGATVRTLSQRTGADIIVGRWSPECQYVSVAYGTPDESGTLIYATVVYDVVNGGEVALFEGARHIPYPLTWDTNSTRLLVETRFGAYIHYLSGGDVWLTSEADGNSRTFRAGSVRWDYAANQLIGVLTIAPFGSAAYDMSSGALVGLTDRFNREMDTARAGYQIQGREDGEKYRCVGHGIENTRVVYQPEYERIALLDSGTRELVRVIIEAVANEDIQLYGWLNQCRYFMFWSAGAYTLYDVEAQQAAGEFTHLNAFQIDPSGRYAIYDTHVGSFLLHLDTGEKFSLNPDVRIETYGSGSVWSYDTVSWDIEHNRVTLGIYYSQWKQWWYRSEPPSEVRVYDLQTGALLSVKIRDVFVSSPEDLGRFAAQQQAPLGCRFRVLYHFESQSVIVRDEPDRTTLAVLDPDIDVQRFAYHSKSPDCRYVAAHVTQNGVRDTVIYDLATQARVGIVPDAVGLDRHVDWSPFGGYALVHTRDGAILWNLTSNVQVSLFGGTTLALEPGQWWQQRDNRVFNFTQVSWDMARGVLLGVPAAQPDRVLAFELSSGRMAAQYDVGGRAAPVRFMRFDNGRILVYTSPATTIALDNGFALWSLDSGDGVQLALNRIVRPREYLRQSPQFSPDGRLMLLRDWKRLYIWDLTALNGSAPHLPNYVFEPETTRGAQFIDNTTIETFELHGDDIQKTERTLYYYNYDAITGALVSERTETMENSYFAIGELPN
jgi:hypothetical protein